MTPTEARIASLIPDPRETARSIHQQAAATGHRMNDKERLDWLEKNLLHLSHARSTSTVYMGGQCVFGQLGDPRRFKVFHRSIREAIDEAAATSDTKISLGRFLGTS